MTSCVVLRIENFTLYRVTTSGKKEMPKEFISGESEWRSKLYQFWQPMRMAVDSSDSLNKAMNMNSR